MTIALTDHTVVCLISFDFVKFNLQFPEIPASLDKISKIFITTATRRLLWLFVQRLGLWFRAIVFA